MYERLIANEERDIGGGLVASIGYRHDHSVSDPVKEYDCYTKDQGEKFGDTWGFIGVIVEIKHTDLDIIIAEDSLWGIEWFWDNEDIEDSKYIQDTVEDVISEALHNARKNVKLLCESTIVATKEVQSE